VEVAGAVVAAAAGAESEGCSVTGAACGAQALNSSETSIKTAKTKVNFFDIFFFSSGDSLNIHTK
jgi:hypothetical protein